MTGRTVVGVLELPSREWRMPVVAQSPASLLDLRRRGGCAGGFSPAGRGAEH